MLWRPFFNLLKFSWLVYFFNFLILFVITVQAILFIMTNNPVNYFSANRQMLFIEMKFDFTPISTACSQIDLGSFGRIMSAVKSMKKLFIFWLDWKMRLCFTDIISILNVLNIRLWFFAGGALVFIQSNTFIIWVWFTLHWQFLRSQLSDYVFVLLNFLLNKFFQCFVLFLHQLYFAFQFFDLIVGIVSWLLIWVETGLRFFFRIFLIFYLDLTLHIHHQTSLFLLIVQNMLFEKFI